MAALKDPPDDDPGTVRALLLGGDREGPPVEIPALPDGSPPPEWTVTDPFPAFIARPSGFYELATVSRTYVLVPGQPQTGRGKAPVRYWLTEGRPIAWRS